MEDVKELQTHSPAVATRVQQFSPIKRTKPFRNFENVRYWQDITTETNSCTFVLKRPNRGLSLRSIISFSLT